MKFSQRYKTTEFASINKEIGLLEGVHIMEVGEAKGHDILIDVVTLSQIIEKGNSQPQGVKCRFGHPNACSEALGTFLGRFKNFRFKDQNTVIADLYLDETAKNTPNGNLYDYVLTMASTNADMFGNSVVVRPDEEHIVVVINDEGEEEAMEVLRVKELIASDLVDEPAATSKLFDTNSFAAICSTFLDEHPEIHELASKHPEIIEPFINKYNQNRKPMSKTTLLDKFTSLFKSDEDVATFNTELSEKLTSLEAQNVELSSKIAEFEAKNLDLEQTIVTLSEAIESNQIALSEVEALRTELSTANADLEAFQTTHEPKGRTQKFSENKTELTKKEEILQAIEAKKQSKK